FAIFVCTMAFQLFRYYVQTVRELEEKTNEVSALNEEIQFLVSAISHDLKAPLISIRGFSALLGEMKEEESEKRRNFLKRVEENAEQMLEWLDDLIRFIKVGWVAGDTEAVDLAKVSQEVEGLLAGPCTERKIRIDWPASWPQLFSSSKGIKQILLNLLQNSVKFSPSDKIVRVECFREHAAIQIWVEDEGPGVPEELRERIFQPFFRHHRDVPGSGMGLAIVKKTAEKLGGRAWLDTEYRSGARFCIYLPDRGRRPEL
ncbi:MAG: HAMP domain-containing histidine kinase, partial [Deltaproteobacteria bacterium]|nr:HAMP domain-containing histidine kinase [Deltaproteobacteria bacterium]